MSEIIQLDPPFEVHTPLGRGYAIIFESDSEDNFWTVALSKTQALVTFRQKEIRVGRNYTYGRGISHEEMLKIIGGNGG